MVPANDFSQRVRDCTDRLAAAGVDALGALFDLTSQRLVRFSVAITRNQHDAEDAVQTSLVRVAMQPRLLAAADNPWAYLLRMVRNEALSIVRSKQRRGVIMSLADLSTRSGDDDLEQEETHRAVWLALRALPPEQAEVVVLKIWESLTFFEIGQILEVSPNTVASRYQYAMTKLATRLSKVRQEACHG